MLEREVFAALGVIPEPRSGGERVEPMRAHLPVPDIVPDDDDDEDDARRPGSGGGNIDPDDDDGGYQDDDDDDEDAAPPAELAQLLRPRVALQTRGAGCGARRCTTG
jgi:hypothetical protein